MAERRPTDEPRTFFDVPVSAGTCALAIGVTGLYWAGKNIEPLTMTAAAFGRQPWRLFTSALVHAHYKESGFAGIFHILFNVSWTYRFGGALEARYGSLRTLLLFLMLAAGSASAEFALFRGGIGLSGVGFGLFGFLWAASRKTREFDDVIDRRVIGAFVAWFFFCIVATYTGVLRVANVAHAMGGVLGWLAGSAATARTKTLRVAWSAALAFALIVVLAAASFFRPLVNVDGFAREAASQGYDLIESNPERATELYRAAVKKEPTNPNYCYNLAVALRRTGHDDEAARLFTRACELSGGSDSRYCD